MGHSSRAILLAALVAAATGCATPVPDSAPDATFQEPEDASGPTLGNQTAPILDIPTDVLHLLGPPALTLTPPNATILTPKGAVVQAQTFTWNHTVSSQSMVTAAEFTLWLRITGSQAQAGGQDPGCTAVATLQFTLNGTLRNVNGGCGSLGLGVVPPGDRVLRFASPPEAFAEPMILYPGDDVRIYVTLYLAGTGLSPSCYLLSSPANDSVVRLVGLNETYAAPVA